MARIGPQRHRKQNKPTLHKGDYDDANKQNVKQDGTKRIKELRAEEINMAINEERESKNQQGKKVFMS